ncbi:hypothetical protein KCV07_g3764, partial [Aureobasidium melanogenum]
MDEQQDALKRDTKHLDSSPIADRHSNVSPRTPGYVTIQRITTRMEDRIPGDRVRPGPEGRLTSTTPEHSDRLPQGHDSVIRHKRHWADYQLDEHKAAVSNGRTSSPGIRPIVTQSTAMQPLEPSLPSLGPSSLVRKRRRTIPSSLEQESIQVSERAEGSISPPPIKRRAQSKTITTPTRDTQDQQQVVSKEQDLSEKHDFHEQQDVEEHDDHQGHDVVSDAETEGEEDEVLQLCLPPRQPLSSEANVLQRLLNALEDYEDAANPADECYAIDRFQQMCQSIPDSTADLYSLFCMMASVLPAVRQQLIIIRHLLAKAKDQQNLWDRTYPHPRGYEHDHLAVFLAYVAPNIPHELKQDVIAFGHCWIHELSFRFPKQRKDVSIKAIRDTQHQSALTCRGLVPAHERLKNTMAKAQSIIDKAPRL